MPKTPQIVTCAEMKEIEKRASEGGLSYYQMMENAGVGAAEFIVSRIPAKGKQVLVFCGKGNNGGDGFVVARILHEHGAAGWGTDPHAVRANYTLAFHRFKPAHIMKEAQDQLGETVCLDIGIPSVY